METKNDGQTMGKLVSKGGGGIRPTLNTYGCIELDHFNANKYYPQK